MRTQDILDSSVAARSERRTPRRVIVVAGLVAVLLLVAGGTAFANLVNVQVFAGAPNGISVVPGNETFAAIVGSNFTQIPDLIGYVNVPPHQTAMLDVRLSGFARCSVEGGSVPGAGCEMQIWLDGHPVGPVVDNRVYHLEAGQTATSGTFSIERVAPVVAPGKHTITVAVATEQTAGCTAPCNEALRLDISSWILTMERFRVS